MLKQKLLNTAIVSAITIGAVACSSQSNSHSPTHSQKTIVELAQGNQDLSILVDAVVAADLVDTLNSKNKSAPFTVFAPTNAAFAELLKTTGLTKAQLLNNKDLLTQVLTHHVIAGAAVKKADVPLGKPIQTLEGDALTVTKNLTIKDGRGGQSRLVATDVMASNGVVHVIDRVLLPSDKNIVDVAQSNNNFSILVEAVVAADLVNTLSNTEGLTVFAPTNKAFADLLSELNMSKAALLANKALLQKVLAYHVVKDTVYSSEVSPGKVASLSGEQFIINNDLSITDSNGRKANIVATDVQASNGVIHVIDQVILPKL